MGKFEYKNVNKYLLEGGEDRKYVGMKGDQAKCVQLGTREGAIFVRTYYMNDPFWVFFPKYCFSLK